MNKCILKNGICYLPFLFLSILPSSVNAAQGKMSANKSDVILSVNEVENNIPL